MALRIGWRALTFAGLRGPERMRQLERILRAESSGRGVFATVLSIALSPDGLGFTAVRAGHPGMLLQGPDSVEWLEPRAGPALGIGASDWADGGTGVARRARAAAADRWIVRGPFRGGQSAPRRDGLLDLARSHASLPGPAFVDAIIAGAAKRAHEHGGLSDDVAVVRVERTMP